MSMTRCGLNLLRIRVTSLLMALFWVAIVAAGTVAAEAHNPRVIPPHAHPHGKTYGQWGALWWQWAAAFTNADSPLTDTTGARCGAHQTGRVWFLAGGFPSP